jgi:hypothetical protein
MIHEYARIIECPFKRAYKIGVLGTGAVLKHLPQNKKVYTVILTKTKADLDPQKPK